MRPVIVCTEHGAVVFGYTNDTTGPEIVLTNARLCIFWNDSVRGVFGLADSGPNENCKVGPAINCTVRSVIAVLEVSAKAVTKWEEAPWRV